MKEDLNLYKDTTPTNLVSLLKRELTKQDIDRPQVEEILNELTDLSCALDQSTIVAVTDRRGTILSVNDKFCEISKYRKEELIGKNHNLLKSGHHPPEFYFEMWKTIMSGNVWEGEVKNRAKDGSYYWVKTVIFPILVANKQPYKFISIRTDITEGKNYEEQVRKLLKNDFAQVMESLDNFVFKLKRNDENDFIFTLIAGKLAKEIGLLEREHLHKSVHEIIPNNTLQKLLNPVEKTFTGVTSKFELKVFKMDLFITLSPFYRNGEVKEVVGSVSDVTELKKSEKIVEHMAYHDSLTDLPNRRKLDIDLTELIVEAKQSNKNVATVFIDLDHFKLINDALGHSVGDYILIMAAHRLQRADLKSYSSEYKLYHLGGDEFVYVFYDIDELRAQEVCDYLFTLFESPFLYKQADIHLKISIGVSLFPLSGETPEELVKSADIAMFEAKNKGRNKYLFYNHDMNASLVKKLQIENDLRKALDTEGELQLHYQPQVDLKTNQIVGVEALIRWIHSEKGFISPIEFIQVAEDKGLIVSLGKWVLKEACSQLKKWQQQGFPHLRVSVNIATKQFQHPYFITDLTQILTETSVSPHSIDLEITENSLLDHTEDTINTLTSIQNLGSGIAIDDFGTGYSSLSYLKNFPISTLKIDQTFVNELPKNRGDRAIVSSIINLAHNLGLNVIAEGVEDEAALNYLKEENCDQMQGYYFSRPVPAADLRELLKGHSSIAK